jgi:site-specific DNA-methyltransferase (adenine-specific)
LTYLLALEDLTPMYSEDGVEVYCANSEELADELVSLDALIYTDPPYGIGERTGRRAAGRSNLAECNDFPPVFGDDRPFDPARWLKAKRLVLWGANHYASRLPDSPSWLVWDKRDNTAQNDNADAELAWSNLGGPARLLHHMHNGMLRESERGEPRVHPTQKPIALAQWAIELAGTDPLIIDPYMGSGSTLIAARALQRRAIGFEISSEYCTRAIDRLRATRELFQPKYPPTKWCAGCRCTLKVEVGVTFNRKASQPDGLQPFCRECDSRQKIERSKSWPQFKRAMLARGLGEERNWTEAAYYREMRDFRCHYCKCEVDEWSGGYWLDKIDPAGLYTPNNVQPCCWPCNCTKSNRAEAVWQLELQPIIARFGFTKVQWHLQNSKFQRVTHPNLEQYRMPTRQLALGM